MGLFVRTIGIARAEAKITLANLAYNIDRLIFHERRAAMGKLRPAKAPSGRKRSGNAALKPETQPKTLLSRLNPRQRHVDVGAHLPAETAMAKAVTMVEAYASAEYGKLHLDCLMACAGDEP